MITRFTHIIVAFLPVLAFLWSLVVLDSFKLIRRREVSATIGLGAAAALLSFAANTVLLTSWVSDLTTFTWYAAPVIEEFLKGLVLLLFIRANRVGFIVDAVIRGFAIGTGFALVENLHYILMRPDAQFFLWVIRGFGTALMHGGTTAILGVMARTLMDKRGAWSLSVAALPLAVAILLHATYNRFILTPLLSTILILIVLPSIFVVIFRRSEQATRDWLGVGFDTDRELLEMITTGVLAENRIGQYLASLQSRFEPAIVVDMLCYIRLHLELAIKAKGLLLMREAGFSIPRDPEVKSQIDELEYLKKNIGKTGALALRTILNPKARELWQVHLLNAP